MKKEILSLGMVWVLWFSWCSADDFQKNTFDEISLNKDKTVRIVENNENKNYWDVKIINENWDCKIITLENNKKVKDCRWGLSFWNVWTYTLWWGSKEWWITISGWMQWWINTWNWDITNFTINNGKTEKKVIDEDYKWDLEIKHWESYEFKWNFEWNLIIRNNWNVIIAGDFKWDIIARNKSQIIIKGDVKWDVTSRNNSIVSILGKVNWKTKVYNNWELTVDWKKIEAENWWDYYWDINIQDWINFGNTWTITNHTWSNYSTVTNSNVSDRYSIATNRNWKKYVVSFDVKDWKIINGKKIINWKEVNFDEKEAMNILKEQEQVWEEVSNAIKDVFEDFDKNFNF